MANAVSEDPRTMLLDIAARLTDNEACGGDASDWLRLFQKNYRHIAATYGLHNNGYDDLASAEEATAAAAKGDHDPH